ncbi:hypothetical protein [Bosea sp. (in: a-proteobacteria)]|uniref:hypothetical protein n=1 Tax=Bosea sp. (in: a-proteobacteria) TaxID=1871050 RepID=UPI002FCBA097
MVTVSQGDRRMACDLELRLRSAVAVRDPEGAPLSHLRPTWHAVPKADACSKGEPVLRRARESEQDRTAANISRRMRPMQARQPIKGLDGRPALPEDQSNAAILELRLFGRQRA